jgi:hypothetical protein
MAFNNLLLAVALTVLWPLGLMGVLAAAEWLERRTLTGTEIPPRRLRPAAGTPPELVPAEMPGIAGAAEVAEADAGVAGAPWPVAGRDAPSGARGAVFPDAAADAADGERLAARRPAAGGRHLRRAGGGRGGRHERRG